MTDVAELERTVAKLVERVGKLEDERRDYNLVLAKLGTVTTMMEENRARQVAFELEVKVEFGHMHREIADLTSRLGRIDAKVDAMPKQIGEIVAGVLREQR